MKVIRFLLVLLTSINLNFCPLVFAMILPGHLAIDQPTFPLPFYNDAERGICFCNATLQCLLQCPKFCLFIDQIKAPKNELEVQLKILRENLKKFSCDEELLWSFLNKPSKRLTDPRFLNLRGQIIDCSRFPCWEIFKYMNNTYCQEIGDCGFGGIVLLSEYLLLKEIVGSELNAFFYSHEKKSIVSLKEIMRLPMDNGIQYVYGDSILDTQGFNDHGLDFFFLFIPSMDLFIVKYVSDLIYAPDISYEIISDIESVLSQVYSACSTRKICKLKAVKCSTKPGFYLGKIASPFYGHCAAYVNYHDSWLFCDDFFRECLDRPLIRKIPGNARDMLDDLICKEKLDCGILFFSAD
ncbi:MAG: hypothetical protein V1646_03275 [bacterium]